MYVYKKATGLSLPHYSVSQLYYGKAVSTKKLVKGDQLFFGSKSAPSHVGILRGRRQVRPCLQPDGWGNQV